MLELISEIVGIVIALVILGGVFYAFYWFLKSMLTGVKKSDD